jgi:hypothetical protein
VFLFQSSGVRAVFVNFRRHFRWLDPEFVSEFPNPRSNRLYQFRFRFGGLSADDQWNFGVHRLRIRLCPKFWVSVN